MKHPTRGLAEKQERKLLCTRQTFSEGLTQIDDVPPQIIVQRSRLPSVPQDAFTGVVTLEVLELFDNDIGVLHPHAFSGERDSLKSALGEMPRVYCRKRQKLPKAVFTLIPGAENVGRIRIARNRIGILEGPDAFNKGEA